ncbi:anti-CBASS protein Acb1 family protein [Immundisolibacter sp.]
MDLTKKLKKAVNFDGWTNVLTAIGIKGRDKRMSAAVTWERSTREDNNHFYSADDIAGLIVDIVPEDAMSKGYKLTGMDAEQEKKVKARLKELHFDERVLEAAKLARIQGGAGIVKITEDAKLEYPVPTNKKILALNVADRWELQINSTDIDGEITSPNFRNPIQYNLQINESSSNVFQPVHYSRVARFDGAYLPRQIMKQNGYWGDSILTKLLNPIRNYQISHDAAAVTIQDFDVPVLKLQNLAEMMAADGDEKILKRLELVNLSKSIAKMIVLDAEKEDFEHKARNVTGMKDVLEKIESRLVTATKMPRNRLFGESSGGMGSTGDAENSNWYDFIENYQANYLKPKMLEIVQHVLISEFPQIKATEVDIEFNPLWQMSEKETVETRKAQAETDKIYLEAGVIDPTEVANSRFGGDKYSIETQIDESLRETTGELTPTEEVVPEPIKADPQTKETAKKVEQMDSKLVDISKQIEQIVPKLAQSSNNVVIIKDEKTSAPAKENEEASLILKKGFAFEDSFIVRDRVRLPLKLKDYSFKGVLKIDSVPVDEFEVLKTDLEGEIRTVIKPEQIEKVISTRMDSNQELSCTVEIMMTTPLGKTKVIQSRKALLYA